MARSEPTTLLHPNDEVYELESVPTGNDDESCSSTPDLPDGHLISTSRRLYPSVATSGANAEVVLQEERRQRSPRLTTRLTRRHLPFTIHDLPMGESIQETNTDIAVTSMEWTLNRFSCLRDHAAMSALPQMQNFIESTEFGNSDTGYWYIMLFPNGESGKHFDGIVAKVVSNNRHSTTARAHFFALPQSNGDPIPLAGFDTFKWFQTSLYYNSVTLCSEEEVENLLASADDDVIRIKCILEVVKKISHSDPNALIGRQNNQQFADGLLRAGRSCLTVDRASAIPVAQPFVDELKAFGESPESRDLIIRCSGQEEGDDSLRASRYVLASRSKVFRAMLFGDFQEAHTKSLYIADLQPELAKNFFDLLHIDRCEWTEGSAMDHEKLLDLLNIADRYECRALVESLVDILIASLNEETLPDVLMAAKNLKVDRLEARCYAFLNNERRLSKVLDSFFLRRPHQLVRDWPRNE